MKLGFLLLCAFVLKVLVRALRLLRQYVPIRLLQARTGIPVLVSTTLGLSAVWGRRRLLEKDEEIRGGEEKN